MTITTNVLPRCHCSTVTATTTVTSIINFSAAVTTITHLLLPAPPFLVVRACFMALLVVDNPPSCPVLLPFPSSPWRLLDRRRFPSGGMAFWRGILRWRLPCMELTPLTFDSHVLRGPSTLIPYLKSFQVA